MDKLESRDNRSELRELTEAELIEVIGGNADSTDLKDSDRDDWDPYSRRRPNKKGG